MSGHYEHDQERIVNMAANALQTAVTFGTQLSMTRRQPVKVKITTASQDVQSARASIQKGASFQEITKSIRASDAYQRVVKAGGNTHLYERLIMQRAEIDHAVTMMPSHAPAQSKTPKKSL